MPEVHQSWTLHWMLFLALISKLSCKKSAWKTSYHMAACWPLSSDLFLVQGCRRTRTSNMQAAHSPGTVPIEAWKTLNVVIIVRTLTVHTMPNFSPIFGCKICTLKSVNHIKSVTFCKMPLRHHAPLPFTGKLCSHFVSHSHSNSLNTQGCMEFEVSKICKWEIQ